MKPIRILHMTGTMNRGGAETLIMELYRHIDRSKVQFDFLVYNYSNSSGDYDREIQELGGNIYSMKSRLYRNPFLYCRELKLFFDSHPEYRIVHAHQFATSGYVLAMAKASDRTIFTIAHSHIAFPKSDVFRNLSDLIGKQLLKRNTDYYFGCSNDALIALTGKGATEPNQEVIKNAIDINKFVFNKMMREKWRKKIGTESDCLIVGNVARFTYQKNHEKIISVFSEITKCQDNCKLVLVGIGSKEAEIKQLVQSMRLSDKVLFMGSRSDVNDIINAFDVFLLPSRYEGLGIVLIEAQANGLPCVISSDVIPIEADIKTELITRMSLDDSDSLWAHACINNCSRIESVKAQQAVKEEGYDIVQVADKLQSFYTSHWRI